VKKHTPTTSAAKSARSDVRRGERRCNRTAGADNAPPRVAHGVSPGKTAECHGIATEHPGRLHGVVRCAATMETILYHYWRSSASWRVRWALSIKGVAFQSVPVNITAGEQVSVEHRVRNPVGHVPALWIDGHTLAESVAILEYLEETRPAEPLYPKDRWARARVRQVVELVNSGIQPLQNLVVYKRHSPDPEVQNEWVRFFNERGLAAAEALLGTIAAEIPGEGHFAVGGALTAADIFLVPQIATARRFGVDLARFPRLVAVEAAALATPHAAGALPENQTDAPR
jgi:maleylacetoacetate isomerase